MTSELEHWQGISVHPAAAAAEVMQGALRTLLVLDTFCLTVCRVTYTTGGDSGCRRAISRCRLREGKGGANEGGDDELSELHDDYSWDC